MTLCSNYCILCPEDEDILIFRMCIFTQQRMEGTMPIRAINDKHYRGISELYRKSDGVVTGYYITYRDAEGKPVKRRVDADTRDEALHRLHEIKQEIDLLKKEKTMSAVLPGPVKDVVTKTQKRGTAAVSASVKTMHAYQEMISDYKGIAVVSLIDIIAFDEINIAYGYETGARMVKEMEELLRNTLEESATKGIDQAACELYHIYAGKFCLFIKEDLSPLLIDLLVKILLKKVSGHRFAISPKNHIQINAVFGATKSGSKDRLLYAEKALQEAKSSHNCYIYQDACASDRSGHLYETLLANINHSKVTPYFQGIFEADKADRPYKFESLMRLVDMDGNIISPVVFLEKSKEFRLYTQLMEQMIQKVLDVVVENDVPVTLNLSYIDISNTELCDTLIEKIRSMQIGHRLTVEILESEQIEDLEMVNEFIFALKKNGVSIAIDDFGSGFSNFDNIANLDIDYIKLDGSLISKIHDRRHRIILENMVNICHDLGIKTIAEYISDESIMELAKSIGVDYLQGYHLHMPEHWECVAETFGMKGGENA